MAILDYRLGIAWVMSITTPPEEFENQPGLVPLQFSTAAVLNLSAQWGLSLLLTKETKRDA